LIRRLIDNFGPFAGLDVFKLLCLLQAIKNFCAVLFAQIAKFCPEVPLCLQTREVLEFGVLKAPQGPAAKLAPRYKLETVTRACSLLRHLSDDGHALTLNEVVECTGLERTICFRLLRTLEDAGFIRRVQSRKYISNLRILDGKRFRVGYASQGHDSFSIAVGLGLRRSASEENIDLIELDNEYSATTALRNAESFVLQHVDLVIEFQVHDRIAPRLSELFRDAEIPVIAVEIPQPDACFFGVDNYKVGTIAGRALLRAAQQQWQGTCDELLLLDLGIAGSIPHLRLSGSQSILLKGLAAPCITTHLESKGEFLRAFEVTRKHLQSTPRRRTLVCGVNDFAVLGALRAFEEAGRAKQCLAVALGAGPEVRRELRLGNASLVGSVAFFPENYGKALISLVLETLHHNTLPPAHYVPVQLVTPRNLSQFYPKDIYGSFDEQ
jgi:ribose transport system substrate-binding protein